MRVLLGFVVLLAACASPPQATSRPTTTSRGNGFEVTCEDTKEGCNAEAKRVCEGKKAVVVGTEEEMTEGKWRYRYLLVCR